MNQLASTKEAEDLKGLIHRNCIACGAENKNGLHLDFQDVENEGVRAVFCFDEKREGYPGLLHGGIISMIMDSAMTNCIFTHGIAAVTAELKIKFRHPVYVRKTATVYASIKRVSPPLYLLESRIIQDDKMKAFAEGKFYDQHHLQESRGLKRV